jgi:hypothetical protein
MTMSSSEEASSSSEAEEHYDTYGPYLVGVFNVGQSTHDAAFDENELDEVLELLRASSEDNESHSKEVWEQLKRDIIAKHEEYTRELQQVQEKQRQEAHLREQERLRHDIEIARTTQPPVEKKKHEMDAQKRALVERFALYEELPEEEEEESEADILVSNKHVAHEANATKTTKESRSAQKTKTTTTKREEQAATKQQKLLKMKAKEERRKRATKSERRR